MTSEKRVLIVKTSIIISVVEFIVLMLLSALPFELNVIAEVLLNVLLLSFFALPLLYYALIRPFIVSRDNAMTEMMSMKKQSDNISAQLRRANALLDEERGVIENLVRKRQTKSSFDYNQLRHLDMPVENLSGDVLFSAYCLNNTQYILLGDFAGHGLTSAIGTPLASDVFHAMARKGLPMDEIVTETNRQLHAKMPIGLFLAAIFIEVNPERNQMNIWNCGMEDVLLFRDQKLVATIASKNLAMGVVDQPKIETTVIDIKNGDRVYGYSDGITEMMNPEGDFFGQERLIQSIENMLNTEAADIQDLDEAVRSFHGGCSPFDDVTLAEIIC